eukprot:2715138-Amphidinium_carterae.2
MLVPTSFLVYLVVTQDWPTQEGGASDLPPCTLVGMLVVFLVGSISCHLGQIARARDPVGRSSRAARLFRFQHSVLWHGCLGVMFTASFTARKVPWTQQGARISDHRLAVLSKHVAHASGGITLTAMLGGIGAVYLVVNVINASALFWKEMWACQLYRQGALNPSEFGSRMEPDVTREKDTASAPIVSPMQEVGA